MAGSDDMPLWKKYLMPDANSTADYIYCAVLVALWFLVGRPLLLKYVDGRKKYGPAMPEDTAAQRLRTQHGSGDFAACVSASCDDAIFGQETSLVSPTKESVQITDCQLSESHTELEPTEKDAGEKKVAAPGRSKSEGCSPLFGTGDQPQLLHTREQPSLTQLCSSVAP